MTTLFDRLKAANADEWQNYTRHPFITQMEAATLPREAFKQYIIQDYHFLIQFCRAYALQGFKARNMEDIQIAQAGLETGVKETESHLQRLQSGWGLTQEDVLGHEEVWTNVAYTRFVLDAGLSGDLLDLAVAQAPCAIGYAEIGAQLKSAVDADPEHPYTEWINEYASDWFQDSAREAIEHIEVLASRSFSEARFEELSRIFRTATRMEAAFWQSGFDLADAAE